MAGATLEAKKDGPYVVSGDCALHDADGRAISVRGSFALCRCGNSSRKPFCDGTHAKIAFDGRRLARGTGAREAYRGAHLTIHDDRSVCAHAGICTDTLPRVFRLGAEPWIDPDGAAPEDIVALVRRCPSGALGVSAAGMPHDAPERGASILCSRNGPFHVRGNVALKSDNGVAPALPDRYTLCRCGASKSKPFCDGTHWAIGFDASRGLQRGVLVPPLGVRRFGWVVGCTLLAGVAAAVFAIEAAGKWSARGILGKAPVVADVNLLLNFALVAGLTYGAWLARRGNLAAHRYNQTIWVLLNALLVVLIMTASLENVALESLADLRPVHYWVPWLHAVLGAVTVGSGLWLVAQMNGLLPPRLHARNWKGLMRATLAGYWAVALLGLAIYYLWFVR